MTYRDPTGYANEPMQSAMLSHPLDNQDRQFLHFELGIVVAVYPADSVQNVSAMQNQQRRGFRHECTVQVVSNGHGGDYRLANVVIPPTRPSGMDNYHELLPRPTSKTISGVELDLSMQRTSPYDLDGDWCVVGFLNGDLRQPFIAHWWPNPNNSFDPQTVGEGSPNQQNQGATLNQLHRYFERTNGVELVITSKGDIYLDTNLAGGVPNYSKALVEGRVARETPTTGGNIRTILKPGAAFEIDWNKPADGTGVLDTKDPQIPQTNPTPSSGSSGTTERENTYLKVTKNVLELTCESFRFTADTFDIIADSSLILQAPDVSIGESGGKSVIQGFIDIGDGPLNPVVTSLVPKEAFNALKDAAVDAQPGSVAQNAAVIKLIQSLLDTISVAEYTNAS